jgi:hypothetical protein
MATVSSWPPYPTVYTSCTLLTGLVAVVVTAMPSAVGCAVGVVLRRRRSERTVGRSLCERASASGTAGGGPRKRAIGACMRRGSTPRQHAVALGGLGAAGGGGRLC